MYITKTKNNQKKKKKKKKEKKKKKKKLSQPIEKYNNKVLPKVIIIFYFY